jgi:hypothetical protein
VAVADLRIFAPLRQRLDGCAVDLQNPSGG